MAVKETTLAAKLDHAMEVSPIAGEEVAADTCVVRQFGKRWLLAVIDGLGHGNDAVHASKVAGRAIEGFKEPHLATILADCHAAMKNTRGAVIGLALIDYRQERLTWLGVGNVAGKVVWRGDEGRLRQSTLLSSPGVVGFNLPKPHQQVYTLKPGALIIVYTDGLSDRWVFPESTWLFEMETKHLVARLMKSYHKGTDDSLVLVARY